MNAAPTNRMPPLALLPLAILFVALMCAGAVFDLPPVRAHSAANQFDANAARARYARVLGDEIPHPVDSDAQDALRARLLSEIRALGFQPEVHPSFTCRPQTRGPFATCAHVENIIFSIGPADAPAILAASHYDSVPAGPGASDDGIGVSAWLEIARVLSHEQLRRRVIFLITDGEEGGLIGAYAFGHGDPLMDQVQALVNLESRGTRGPAIFFETNEPNGDALAAFSVVPRPVANSVAADIYHLLPNSTDVTTLSRPGLDVINVSVIDGLEDYHTPHDTLASADPRSLQHTGDIGLDVTRRLARAPDANSITSMVYTDIVSRWFIAMPTRLAQALLALCALIAGAAFWRSGAETRWRTLAAPFVGLAFAGLLSAAAGFALGLVFPGRDFGFAHPEPMRAWGALLAILALVLAWMLLRASRKPEQAQAAAMFCFTLIGVVFSVLLSGSTILYVLPALPYAAGCLVALVWRSAQTIGAIVAALVALIVWTPTLYLFELSLGFAYPFALSILAAILALTWIGLAAALQGEHRWRGTAAALAVASAACIVASALTPASTRDRPQPLNITYVLNTTDNQAQILAGSAQAELPSALAGAFHPNLLLPGDQSPSWLAPTEAVPFEAPVLQDLAVTQEGAERTVHAHLKTNGARRVFIRMPLAAQPLRAIVRDASVDFAETGTGGDIVTLACEGRACDGADITITLAAAGEAGDWSLVGQFPGAPVPPAVTAMRARRPADTATPIQFGDGAATITRLRPFG